MRTRVIAKSLSSIDKCLGKISQISLEESEKIIR